MIKKSLVLFCIIIILSVFVSAENKIKIETEESFSAGENINFMVSLYDAGNNLINADVDVILEDAEKTAKIEETFPSNKLVDISLGENARHGFWKITAKYQDPETNDIIEGITLFSVEMNEEIKFELKEDTLIITNIGNTRYIKTVQIIIGDTLGTKKLDLDIGEKINLRLIAPDGTYNVKITDGKTTLTRSDVALSGKAVGILDERLTTGSSPVTGGIKPGEGSEEGFYSILKGKNFIYVFFIVVIGAAILLAIERRFRKKVA